MATLLTRSATEVPRAMRAAPYPRQLVLDWTDYCNAKCFFCFREKYEKAIGGMGEFVPFATLKKLEDVFRKVKVFGISSGIGEPLLHPELDEILTWLYSINPAILLQVVTNGTTLTGAKAAWFAGHLDWLSVSLNAANGEAHMRDMFPHLAKRGIDAEKRWNLHIRRLTEFLAALPVEDRARVRFQMVTHRHNVKDVFDFVRLVHDMGGSQAVITNISVHPDTLDWSLYWIKDQYNDAVEQACELGARLGVRVQAVRFYTGVKPQLDLDKVCQDPVDIAYISRSSHASPCCHWTEDQIPVDYYNDELGFERYWNSDLLEKLRRKRDFASCRVCGMSRIFDETSFHFSPQLKQLLIQQGRLSEIGGGDDYPEAQLVRACAKNRLDLPSVRRTLLDLRLPVETSEQIQSQGLSALVGIDGLCWEAFQRADVSITNKVSLGGPFLGIGWDAPVYEPQNRLSARPLCAAQAASVFLRVDPTLACEIRFAIHHVHPAENVKWLGLEVCGQALSTKVAHDLVGRTVLTAVIPDGLRLAYEGRLWVRIGYLDRKHWSAGQVSFTHLLVCEPSAAEVQTESEKDLLIAQQQTRLSHLENELQAVYASRSWRLTLPLRKARNWALRLRRSP